MEKYTEIVWKRSCFFANWQKSEIIFSRGLLFFIQKVKAQLYELRKVVYGDDLNNITHFKGLQWRFEVELASKTNKNIFNPNMFLNIQTE